VSLLERDPPLQQLTASLAAAVSRRDSSPSVTRSGAHREAAAQYARALRFAGHLDPAERARLLERRSHECYTADMPGEAAADLRRTLARRGGR
jgi:hypothetical protein